MKICFQYVVERHGKTLLPQYLGMYRLTVDGDEHYVVAMRNVFSNHLATHKYYSNFYLNDIILKMFILLYLSSYKTMFKLCTTIRYYHDSITTSFFLSIIYC